MSTRTWQKAAGEAHEALERRGWAPKLRKGWAFRDIGTLNRAETAYSFAMRFWHACEAADSAESRADAFARARDDMRAQRDALAANLAKMEGDHAEEVERLKAEVERLRGDLDAMKQRRDKGAALTLEFLNRAEAAEAEVKRLKAAPQYHTVGFDYGAESGSVTWLAATKASTDPEPFSVAWLDALDGSTTAADDKPPVFKVGDVVTCAGHDEQRFKITGFPVFAGSRLTEIVSVDADGKRIPKGHAYSGVLYTATSRLTKVTDEPTPHKVGDIVRYRFGDGVWRVTAVATPMKQARLEIIDGPRRIALTGWEFVTPWTPEPGDVVRVNGSPCEWVVVKVHGSGTRPIEIEYKHDPADPLTFTSWAAIDELTPLR